MKGTIKFIDLFAGIGGIRCGLELAAHEAGYKTECVFVPENRKITCPFRNLCSFLASSGVPDLPPAASFWE